MDQRERRPLREALEREQDRAAGAVLDVGQDLEVGLERPEVGDEARGLERPDVDRAGDLGPERGARAH